MSQEKLQHKEFVQSTITRMNSNSFEIKKICVTIIAASCAVYASTKNIIFLVIPIPLTLIMWIIDSYYLQLEKKFRGIYNDICELTATYERKTNLNYEMDPSKYKGVGFSFLESFILSINAIIYFSLIVFLTTAVVLISR
jgi:hypothetical protein